MKLPTFHLLAFVNTATSVAVISGAVDSITQTLPITVSATLGSPPVSFSSAIHNTGVDAPTATGVIIPQPIQEGTVNNCNLFYLVKSGDMCPYIAEFFGISFLTLRTWNPAIGTDCSGLVAETYICTGIEGEPPIIKSACSSNATAEPWGDRKADAIYAAYEWCNSKVGAPGQYINNEKRTGCLDVPPFGQNTFHFEFTNEWGYPRKLVSGWGSYCKDVLLSAINVCDVGGSARIGGWEGTALISSGQC